METEFKALWDALLAESGEGLVARVQAAMQHSPQLAKMKGGHGGTLLHLAARTQSGATGARIVQLLHQAYPPAALTPEALVGALPLHVSAASQVGASGAEVVQALLRAEPRAALVGDKNGLTPLHYAAKLQDGEKGTQPLEALLQAEPKAATLTSNQGDLPLHRAAYYQGVEVPSCLLSFSH
jgi:hypothetical protein